MTTRRSVFSNRYHASSQDRRALMMPSVPEGSTSAADALARMGNAVPRIEKSAETLKYLMPIGMDDAMEVDTGMHALYRRPGWELDQRERHIAIVGGNYTVITPDDMASAWDEIVGQKPDSIQFQNGGTTMYMEAKVGEFEMKPVGERKRGDVLESYLWFSNPTDGGGSARGGLREVRLACTNGLIRQTVAVGSFEIKHDFNAFEHMKEWWAHTVKTYSGIGLTEICESYNRLTEERASLQTIRWIMTELYPLPEAPKQADWDVPRKTSFAEAMERWHTETAKVIQTHEAIEGLWKGGGTEIASVTAFDALNVFTEFENYRKGTAQTQFIETVTGDRAKNMAKAWEMLQAHVENPVHI